MSRTRELEEQIRAVLNEVVFSNLDDPTPVVDQVFRLSYDKWGELCQALDLLGDTELAIEYYLNFQEKSVEPTGNKYLQMYGVLNAAYLQMNS